MLVAVNVTRDPVKVADGLRRAGDDVEFIAGQANERQVALKAAAFVEQTRVNGLANSDVNLVATKPLQNVCGIAAFEDEFGEAGLIEDRDLLPRGAMFGGVVGKPVLAAERVFRHGFFCVAGNLKAAPLTLPSPLIG